MYLDDAEARDYIMHIKASVTAMTARFARGRLMATLGDVLRVAFLCFVTSDSLFM